MMVLPPSDADCFSRMNTAWSIMSMCLKSCGKAWSKGREILVLINETKEHDDGYNLCTIGNSPFYSRPTLR